MQPTLDAVVSTVAAATGFDAGLVLVAKGVLEPQAATGDAPHRLDLTQRRLGAGPCLEAAQRQVIVRVTDVVGDARWPEFCAEAVRLGVRSMVCSPLRVEDRFLGTLSLYADRPAAFSAQDEQVTTLFATLAAQALADAQLAEQLRVALENRDVIGQAKGILMEREKIPASDAFTLLAARSQIRNVKLAVVAEHLVQTGELLG